MKNLRKATKQCLNPQKQVLPENGDINEFRSHLSTKMINENYAQIVPWKFKFKLISSKGFTVERENLVTAERIYI